MGNGRTSRETRKISTLSKTLPALILYSGLPPQESTALANLAAWKTNNVFKLLYKNSNNNNNNKQTRNIIIIITIIIIIIIITTWLMESGDPKPHSQGPSNIPYPVPNQFNFSY